MVSKFKSGKTSSRANVRAELSLQFTPELQTPKARCIDDIALGVIVPDDSGKPDSLRAIRPVRASPTPCESANLFA
jgi:hypothetical protein